MTGEKLVKFAVKLNGKPGIALLDPGSEVNRNFVKKKERIIKILRIYSY